MFFLVFDDLSRRKLLKNVTSKQNLFHELSCVTENKRIYLELVNQRVDIIVFITEQTSLTMLLQDHYLKKGINLSFIL